MTKSLRKRLVPLATIGALVLGSVGLASAAQVSPNNTVWSGYIVCISKTSGEMRMRLGETCPAGFTTKVFGSRGMPGQTGAAGAAGEAGVAGAAGPKGDQGTQGLQGLQGEQGPQGAQGDPGAQGAQGDPGAQGLPGQNGLSEVYYSSGWHVPLNGPSGVTSLTSLTLPAGTYLVTASSTFENDGSQTPESWVACWVENQDGAIQVSGESRAVTPITMIQPFILNAGATLTFKCAADYSVGSIGAKAPSLSAIKVDQLHWQF